MKQDKRPAGAAVKKRRFFNRISRKLMLFVVLMSMVLLALVWLLSVKLLEPMYNRRVLADLNHAADVYSAIIEKYGIAEGMAMADGLKVTALRTLARECGELKISGREVSKANKQLLLEELKSYYEARND